MKTRREAEFVSAKAHAKLTTGEVIRMLRELKGWTQAELARRSGIRATNISLLENEKVEIGKKRVEQLARIKKTSGSDRNIQQVSFHIMSARKRSRLAYFIVWGSHLHY